MKPYAIGIDVGGTKIAAGLINQKGTILTRYNSQAHAEQQPEVVIEAIAQACQTVLTTANVNPAEVEAVGLGFGGNTNGPAGLVLVSSNLPAWDNIPLRNIVSERLGLPVILENDTNMGALGEHRYGAGRGHKNICYVTFSTGYGMGLILNNRLYVGHTGTAGEVGHVTVKIGGPLCSCGKSGCLMTYASGIGISRMAYEKIEAGAKTLLREMAPPDKRRIKGEMVSRAAQQGDKVAQDILYTASYYAGTGLAMVIQIINPELIVVGGGLTRIGPPVMDPMMTGLRENTQPEMLNSTKIVPWQLGDDLGLVGAAAKVFDTAESRA